MDGKQLQDFLAKGANAPRPSPADRRRNLANAKMRNDEGNAYDPQYRAPFGKGSSVAFTPGRKK